MTCIDDDASSHLGVSDGAASEQKTLTAEASPGLVRMLPGKKEWKSGGVLLVSVWFLARIIEPETLSKTIHFLLFPIPKVSAAFGDPISMSRWILSLLLGRLGEAGPSKRNCSFWGIPHLLTLKAELCRKNPRFQVSSSDWLQDKVWGNGLLDLQGLVLCFLWIRLTSLPLSHSCWGPEPQQLSILTHRRWQIFLLFSSRGRCRK